MANISKESAAVLIRLLNELSIPVAGENPLQTMREYMICKIELLNVLEAVEPVKEETSGEAVAEDVALIEKVAEKMIESAPAKPKKKRK